jgi:hypothetical protein
MGVMTASSATISLTWQFSQYLPRWIQRAANRDALDEVARGVKCIDDAIARAVYLRVCIALALTMAANQSLNVPQKAVGHRRKRFLESLAAA